MKQDEIKDLNMIVDSFIETTIPDDASDIQKRETKKAFICGMIFGFRLPTDIDLSDEENAMKQLTSYNIQLKEMEDKISKGE